MCAYVRVLRCARVVPTCWLARWRAVIVVQMIVSVPFRTCKLWAFFAMLSQLPLIVISKKLLGGGGGSRKHAAATNQPSSAPAAADKGKSTSTNDSSKTNGSGSAGGKVKKVEEEEHAGRRVSSCRSQTGNIMYVLHAIV